MTWGVSSLESHPLYWSGGMLGSCHVTRARPVSLRRSSCRGRRTHVSPIWVMWLSHSVRCHAHVSVSVTVPSHVTDWLSRVTAGSCHCPGSSCHESSCHWLPHMPVSLSVAAPVGGGAPIICLPLESCENWSHVKKMNKWLEMAACDWNISDEMSPGLRPMFFIFRRWDCFNRDLHEKVD